MNAIFEDVDEAAGLLCDEDGGNTSCDPLDMEFPIREYLVPALIELVTKELTGVKFQPQDKKNDANDNLSEVRTQK